VIHNRAIEDEPVAAIGTRHRLFAVGWVEDREPSHSERRALPYELAFIIGPAMLHRRAHLRNRPLQFLLACLCANKSRYPAHWFNYPALRRLIFPSFAPSLPDWRVFWLKTSSGMPRIA